MNTKITALLLIFTILLSATRESEAQFFRGFRGRGRGFFRRGGFGRGLGLGFLTGALIGGGGGFGYPYGGFYGGFFPGFIGGIGLFG